MCVCVCVCVCVHILQTDCVYQQRQGLGSGLGLDLVSGWLVVMHTYLYYFRLSLSHCLHIQLVVDNACVVCE